MGFRFRKSFRLAPGVRLNLSKSGVSTSIGVKGLTANVSKRGIRGTASLPGTGLSYSGMVGTKVRKAHVPAPRPLSSNEVAASTKVDLKSDDLPVTENSAILMGIVLFGVVMPVIMASIAAGSVIGWFGWLVCLLAFGLVMLTLGRASADVG